jgi:hypothetical protein
VIQAVEEAQAKHSPTPFGYSPFEWPDRIGIRFYRDTSFTGHDMSVWHIPVPDYDNRRNDVNWLTATAKSAVAEWLEKLRESSS